MGYDQHRVMALLKDSLAANAEEILIKVPGKPMFRAAGRLLPTPHPEITPEQTNQVAQALLTVARRELPLAALKDASFSFGVQGLGRFRAHLYRQRGSFSIVIHRISFAPPSLLDLGLPPLATAVAWGGAGLTLVAGQRRHAELLAALTREYNQTATGHLISVEYPTNFLHKDHHALISQCEVGVDVDTYLAGVQRLRFEVPDAVVVHDLPDAEVAEEVLRCAERGTPVVAGIEGCRPGELTRWFCRMFPERREAEISERLCLIMRGVIAERHGKMAVMPISPAIRELILRRRPLPPESFGEQKAA